MAERDAEPCLIADPLFTLSETLPTEEGWYWHKPNRHYLLPYILQVMMRNIGKARPMSVDFELALCVYRSTAKEWVPVSDIGGLWSERIPEPGNA